jgi:hypothetical protein
MRFIYLLATVTFVAACARVVTDPAESSSSSSATSSSSSSTSSGECPAQPAIGGPCTTAGATCPVPFGCCNGTATCQGGVWVYSSLGCAEACVQCGPQLACTGNAVCVVLAYETESYTCHEDICPATPDCSCDQAICDEHTLACISVQSKVVRCECPNC